MGAAVLALVVTLVGLPAGEASTAGTPRDGDRVHGTPATPPRPAGPSPGWERTRRRDGGRGSGEQRGQAPSRP
ncbi:hypothetical protein [Streptomyces echinatus]|uniref:Secreted protein n=1 Tax=Streptomyces echinatus TaxID=67293 RepID=A0A7W9Q060_9ACTN|nr:hypothetical protein [Streptomyces echinatus]MBB5930417.1 hypothetical protein [Streptomyces echinatus]